MNANPTQLVHKVCVQAVALLFLMFISLSSKAQLTFENRETISIPGEGMAPIPGQPYPSAITVANVKGVVSGLTLTLYNYWHTNPDAVDILLVAPDGTNAIVLSDVGGAVDIEGIDIVLDDAAAANLPDNTTYSSGTYKPTNMGFGPDTWPAPAPAAAGLTALSSFDGIDPNGTWKLYVINDMDGASGMFRGGWSLTFNAVKDNANKVKFNDFTATYIQQQNQVLLKWSTDAEFNVNSFVIERSLQGSAWQPVGEVKASGTSTSGSSYQFTDAGIKEGNYLYRIKVVEKDQSFTYSKVISINVTGKQTIYTVYPNPASSYTNVISDSKTQEMVVVSLTDMNRNILIQQQGMVSSTTPLRIDLSLVARGIYYLILTTKNSQFAETITVNK